MADPVADRSITIDGKSYTLRYTFTALRILEKLTGMKVNELMMHLGGGQIGADDLARWYLAGLEGYRRKVRIRTKEWTLEEVDDLIEAAAEDGIGFVDLGDPVYGAFEAAVIRFYPNLFDDADEAVNGSSAGGDDEDPPMAAGTSTDSSSPPSEQG